MSEGFTEEHKKLYNYAGNANLVLTSDRPKGARRGERGKEIESLWGKIDRRSMGANVRAASLPKRAPEATRQKSKRGPRPTFTDSLESTYQPQTLETKRIWELLLTLTRPFLGDQTMEVLYSAADEMLAILKTDDLREAEKRKQVEKLFGSSVNEAEFSRFIQLARQITDYSVDHGEDMAVDAGDEDGVAVVFGGSEDEDEEGNADGEPARFVVDDGSSDDEAEEAEEERVEDDGGEPGAEEASEDEAVDDEAGGYRTVIHGYGEKNARQLNRRNEERTRPAAQATSLQQQPTDSAPADETSDDAAVEKDSGPVRPSARSIDAFWLQRQVSKYYSDAVDVQQKTREALRLLSNRRLLGGELENELAEAFDYEHFDLVQTLVSSRELIVWCMRLARAESEADKEQVALVEEEMRELGLAWIIAARSGNNEISEEAKPTETNASAAEAAEAALEKDFVPEQDIDLAELAFEQGGHLMTNEKWVPPKGAVKAMMDGYEEIRVPAPERLAPPGDDEPAVPISSIPLWAQAAFKGTTTLNRIQSRVYATAFESDENMLICAPTGAGKTNCAALTMLRTIGQFRDAGGHIDVDAFKMVYIAPMKALVSEMARSFAQRLEPLGLKVAELTGDSQLTKQQITETQLIVTTPEKWDVVTRKGSEGSYTDLVRLVIVDEIHLLHDGRGPVLESVVCREMRRAEDTRQVVRIVGLSATLPNYEDVAAFLRVRRDSGLFYFDARYRPCPLQLEFVGVSEKKAVRRAERMDQVCYEKVRRHAAVSQVLVFVQSRKDTVRTGQKLRDMAVAAGETGVFVKAGSSSSEVLREEAEATKDRGLKELLPFGIACHHAGMARVDRQMVEELFEAGHVKALVSTATLAWGVNLPAHAVIIKGTQVYRPEEGRWGELSPQDVLQMLGRAGRPQYDTEGEGVIITTHSELRYYLSLLSQQLPIESQLVSRLPDALNAEVAAGAVRSRADAVAWLGRTYLYVRMLRSPTLYGVTSIDSDPALVRRRNDLAHAAIVVLERSGLVRYERRGGEVLVTEAGRVAAHFYVGHRSVAAWRTELRAESGPMDVLQAFAHSDEFIQLAVRADERVEVARLAERVPVPVRDSADSPAAKAAVLVQAYVARLNLPGFALAADLAYVAAAAGRIFRALFELSKARGWARAAKESLAWARMVDRRTWAAESPLRQLGKACPPELLRSVERSPMAWARLADLNPAELAELLGAPRAGPLLHKLVHTVPRLGLRAHVQPLTRSLVRVSLRVTPDFAWNDAAHGVAERFWVCVEDASGAQLIHAEPLVISKAHATEEHVVEFACTLADPLPPQYFVVVMSDRWVGADTRLAVSFRHLRLPERAPPPTALRDMQPMRDDDIERLLGVPQGLNAVQTQAFHALWGSDDSVLLAAAPGAGKTRAADLALLRFLSAEAERARAEGEDFVRRRAVYVAPFAALVRARAADWRHRLGALHGGTRFAVVSGGSDASADLRRMEDAHVILATPTAWDRLSRRWRQRQRHAVRDIGLFIADEIHWIGGAGLGAAADDVAAAGPSGTGDDAGADAVGDRLAAAYEAVVSRTRYMAAQLERPIRVVALAVPLANAKDVAAWIGATQVFNFHPAVRPVPLEIKIQASGVMHFASRMAALVAPTYRAVCESPQAAIVFVATRRQCRALAAELLTRASADGLPDRFMPQEAAEVPVGVKDAALREFLAKGIGYYHDAMAPGDRKAVADMFAKGLLRVLVASREACWALDSVVAHTVVIMGAERFVGREHRYADYSVPEVLQMMGRASTAQGQAKCVLMCMANKRDFYKKFLYEPLPVESRLDAQLHDLMNAEVVAKTIENKQDAVDYLTWTFLYRRLAQNPNYYGLQGTSHQQLSDYLSELIESTLGDLSAAKCVTVDEEDVDVTPTNLGMIAAYYQISYLTVEMFALSLAPKTKLRGVLDIVSAADEFDALPIRHREGGVLARIASRLPVPLPKAGDGEDSRWASPRVRTHLLLQAHFSRLALPADLAADQAWVLASVLPLLQAMVDVASSMGWLAPALAAMELSQMAVQAVWEGRDPLVKQVPHLAGEKRIEMCKQMGVETVFDVMDMEDDDRSRLLDGLAPGQVAEVAEYVNRYPNIEVSFNVDENVEVGSSVAVRLELDREWDEDEEDVPGDVKAPFFPYSRAEGWWIVIAEPGAQTLLAVKRIAVGRHLATTLEFAAPEKVGNAKLKMFLMCDAYLGCDQEFDVELNVLPATDEDDDDDEEL
ncbi:Pre-mRNA-splicing helicase BRR2 [Coemansia sp. RSA 922]|nr:Pre-mRNA-splicing helicase BRR2 [Coemansia sp. RSA 922]